MSETDLHFDLLSSQIDSLTSDIEADIVRHRISPDLLISRSLRPERSTGPGGTSRLSTNPRTSTVPTTTPPLHLHPGLHPGPFTTPWDH